MSKTDTELLREIAAAVSQYSLEQLNQLNLNDNALLKIIATNISTGSSGSGVASPPRRITTRTVNSDLQLISTDNEIQNLENPTNVILNIFLPANPETHEYFEIINQISSAQSLITNGVTLSPGDQYVVIFDGTNWIPL